MAIPLVESEDVRTGRGGVGKRGSGEKYTKYKSGLGPQVPWIKDQIGKNPDHAIRIKNRDILGLVSGVGKHSTSIYWGVKYTLYQYGLWVTSGKHKDGDDVLVIRYATQDDVLPDSLAKKAAEAEKGNGEKGEQVGEEVGEEDVSEASEIEVESDESDLAVQEETE